jgi:hypothetical protein
LIITYLEGLNIQSIVLKKIIFAACIIAVFGYTNSVSVNPHASISNGLVTATLYLPDIDSGYYRGARFDWAGQISELTYDGHSFFGLWYERYDPFLHDAIMGPVEAFDPIGYETAAVGGTFVKIGIGALEKPNDKEYFFANNYKLINHGKWKIRKAADKIEFTHTLNDTTISYVYTKMVQLVKGKPQMVLMHTLKNTGKKTIETDVMNHNFFVIDTQETGPDFEVDLSFDPAVDSSAEPRASSISGRQILLESGDPRGKNFYLGPIKGFSNSASDYNITVKNKKTGAGVNIISDKPFSRLAFWATVKTVCPEPFVHVKADPGKEVSWTTTYTFFSEEHKKGQ